MLKRKSNPSSSRPLFIIGSRQWGFIMGSGDNGVPDRGISPIASTKKSIKSEGRKVGALIYRLKHHFTDERVI